MDDCVNPSSPHRLSYQLQRQLTTAAAGLAALVTGKKDTGVQVIWTSGGTEANNLAILGFAGARSGPLRIVATRTEHASVLAPLEHLQGQGAKLQLANVHDSGRLDLDHLAACLDDGADLVSICHVQNETGAIQDLTAIRELIDHHAPGARLQVDAMQSFGKIDIDWQSARIDMLSLSGHKIHGPGGQGALIVRDGCRIATNTVRGAVSRTICGPAALTVSAFGCCAWQRPRSPQRARRRRTALCNSTSSCDRVWKNSRQPFDSSRLRTVRRTSFPSLCRDIRGRSWRECSLSAVFTLVRGSACARRIENAEPGTDRNGTHQQRSVRRSPCQLWP